MSGGVVRGSYVLDILVRRLVRLKVGRLGVGDFPPGRYFYVGSALGGLKGRLERHARGGRLHWHVDSLLRKGRLEGAWVIASANRLECRIAKMLKGPASVVMPGFGASDCRCETHLLFAADGADPLPMLSAMGDGPVAYWARRRSRSGPLFDMVPLDTDGPPSGKPHIQG